MTSHTPPVRTVLIVRMRGNERAKALALEIEPWLAARKIDSLTVDASDLPLPGEKAKETVEAFLERTDLTLALGGDGTMLNVANRLCCRKIVLLGVNCGKVGFLAECDAQDWPAALESIVRGGVKVKPRIRLSVHVVRGGEDVFTCRVANDAVISRGALARLVNLRLMRGGELITELRADGVAVSTPSGSTAYCVSAGGPLIHPSLDVMCVTPICPFLSHVKPLVLPCDQDVSIMADKGETYLTCDGQTLTPLEPLDVVRIHKSREDLLLASPGAAGFFERIRKKGIYFRP
ncbi:MAG: NAD(+)/NADH kinase [Desulfovibrionaceae bacterium]|nr:NAD(+)/NADH kinase [Desulfovibrionaceae bacterium]MBF0513256.1 NAD(+)/NADH kinase [Desulfovibrionaceae bacterium]